MITRSEQQSVEAAVEKNFDVKQYAWHKYTSSRGTKLKGPRGSEVVLRNGDLYGVKEYNSKQDMYLVLKMPTAVFKINIPASDKLMNEKSVEVKGKKPTLPKNPPTKIKVDMAPPAGKKTVKEAAAPKAVKPKLTANQKKIVAVKMEIKRLRGLTQNGTNLRKIEAQKAELKKLQAKEKAAGPSTPKAKVVKAPKAFKGKITIAVEDYEIIGRVDGKTIAEGRRAKGGYLVDYSALGGKDVKVVGNAVKTKAAIQARLETFVEKLKSGKITSTLFPNASGISAPKTVAPKPEPETKEKAVPKAKAPKAAEVKLPPEFEAARTLLKAIDKGGVPLNTMKLNLIGRELGLEINSNAKPDATIERIRAAVERAVDSAVAEQAHSKKPTRMRVNLETSQDDDDDDDEFDHGGIVDIDELEFDDDVSGLVDVPLPESWSASTSGVKRKSKRLILDNDDEEETA